MRNPPRMPNHAEERRVTNELKRASVDQMCDGMTVGAPYAPANEEREMSNC